MNRLNFNQLDAGNVTTLDFDMSSCVGNMITTFDPLIEWLPKSSIWKRYRPTWHLVRSYK